MRERVTDVKVSWNIAGGALFFLVAALITTTKCKVIITDQDLVYVTDANNSIISEEEDVFGLHSDLDAIIVDSNNKCEEGRKELNRVLDSASAELISDPQEPKNGTLNFCSSVAAYLSNQASYILQQAKLLTVISMEDKITFEILKKEFTIELAKFAAVLENSSENHNRDLSIIKEELSNLIKFKKYISDFLDLNEIIPIMEANCVSQIQNGDHESASVTFRSLREYSSLTKIVNKAYGGNVDKLPNAIRFLNSVDSCENQGPAYEALYNNARTKEHLNIFNVMLFPNSTGNCVSVSFINKTQKFKVQAMKALLREAKSEDILQFENKYLAGAIEIYSILVDELKCESAKETEDYLVLDDDEGSGRTCKDLMTLGYRVKHIEQLCLISRYACSSDLRAELLDMKVRFPDGMIPLLFGAYLTVESKQHPGYGLYLADDGVHTYPLTNNSVQRWTGRLAPDGLSLELEHVLSGGRLYVQDRTLLVGSYNGTAGHWEVIPEGEYFYLRSRKNGQMLDANSLLESPWSPSGFTSLVQTYEWIKGHDYQLWKFY